MLAYFIPNQNRYVRTQGEAKKLGFGDETNIPTDKDGLLAFVNDLITKNVTAVHNTVAIPQIDPELGFVAVDKAKGEVHVVRPDERGEGVTTIILKQGDPRISALLGEPGADTSSLDNSPMLRDVQAAPMNASAVLSRMDNPTLDLDNVVEAIAKMKGGHALKRVAGAVAMRFEELSK